MDCVARCAFPSPQCDGTRKATAFSRGYTFGTKCLLHNLVKCGRPFAERDGFGTHLRRHENLSVRSVVITHGV